MSWKTFTSFNHALLAASAAILTNRLPNEDVDNLGDEKSKNQEPKSKPTLSQVRKKCRRIVSKKLVEFGAPGMVVGVSFNGDQSWVEGFGFADIENSVPCTPATVMRIASISKSLTMAAVAKLVENGKLDLDKPVQEYVPEFPPKYWDGKEVKITTRMLLCHTGGVRHYTKKGSETKTQISGDKGGAVTKDAEYASKEYYSMKEYMSVIEALNMFKNDEVIHPPGGKYLYTTHGWTLISAVTERAAGEDFVLHMRKLFSKFGMHNTEPENAEKLVYHRAKQYTRNDKGRLVNSPYVNNSYKWAGGGFISDIPDLLTFGNIMLFCAQSSGHSNPNGSPVGFLKPETMQEMWAAVVWPEVKKDEIPKNQSYGLGWFVYPKMQEIGGTKGRRLEVAHTGGAIGGSSVLYIMPLGEETGIIKGKDSQNSDHCSTPPKGIVVAILTNLQSVGLTDLGREIANEFLTLTNVD